MPRTTKRSGDSAAMALDDFEAAMRELKRARLAEKKAAAKARADAAVLPPPPVPPQPEQVEPPAAEESPASQELALYLPPGEEETQEDALEAKETLDDDPAPRGAGVPVRPLRELSVEVLGAPCSAVIEQATERMSGSEHSEPENDAAVEEGKDDDQEVEAKDAPVPPRKRKQQRARRKFVAEEEGEEVEEAESEPENDAAGAKDGTDDEQGDAERKGHLPAPRKRKSQKARRRPLVVEEVEEEVEETEKCDDADDEADDEHKAGPPVPAPPKKRKKEESQARPQLVLYSATTKGDRRPVLHVYDAKNDLNALSSRLVRRAAWVANAPQSLLFQECSLNKAVCQLRDANAGVSKGTCGVNKNLALCVNASGKPMLLKAVLEARTLRRFLQQ